MNVFYEESGSFKVGAILADNATSLQVEAAHGKRSKIKAASVLLRFETPALSEFLNQAQKVADELDPDFLWECCIQDGEFESDTLAADYFGHTPDPVEAAATMILLHNAPMYFYKKGKGRYKAAPPDALKAAIAGQERKRQQAELKARYVEQLCSGILPEEFKSIASNLLYKPDKNTIEWKALYDACAQMKLSVPRLLEKCGAITSSHDYHFNQFLWEHFPNGIDFSEVNRQQDLNDSDDLPIAEVAAFSIDDASTTEIDDAFSITPLKLGSFRIGIHIAAPALGIQPDSPLDETAADRLSTVYVPGKKITMLPDTAINHYTLGENRICPAVSLYLDVADDYTVTHIESRIEKINIAANLRHDTLEIYFNENTLSENDSKHPFIEELRILWHFAGKMETIRGKANDTKNDKIDYTFDVSEGHVTIRERRRGSPIDKVVSELMIYANTEWGKQLANANIAGIYRSQGNGKVKMSTSPAPHQGLGVAQYAWISSPMRRYVDLINQRQLIAMIRNEAPPYTRESDSLLIAMRDFEIAHSFYSDFQRAMEHYWCLRWLLQEHIETINAQVIKENLVKFDHMPLIMRISSLPNMAPDSYVKLEIQDIDLWDRSLQVKFVEKLES
ncbi:ribonuclease catalytic domain-containing protein [Nitrosomonas sp.]|uniref:ribonuclease catalytic domain-containing protein n=1 Tax=Nitrosomonas sp. TaxID=42353 RepID=UPI00208ABB41|nr:RNB domain-containing ribonuclease [Nitrosomonas sp.]GJL75730.1 MAG: exoribonuclease II [Nitrosomonas sp.]